MKNKSHKTNLAKLIPGICSLLFIILIIISLVVGLQYVSFSVTEKFSTQLKPIAVIVTVIFTAQFTWFGFTQTNQVIKSKTGSTIRKFFYSLYVYFFLILGISLFGYLIYSSLINVPAEIMHSQAEKEYFTMDVTIESITIRSKRTVHPDYKYSAFFTAEDFFSTRQFIRLTKEQRDKFFLNKELPITATLYGEKSDYGYDFHCCIANTQ